MSECQTLFQSVKEDLYQMLGGLSTPNKLSVCHSNTLTFLWNVRVSGVGTRSNPLKTWDVKLGNFLFLIAWRSRPDWTTLWYSFQHHYHQQIFKEDVRMTDIYFVNVIFKPLAWQTERSNKTPNITFGYVIVTRQMLAFGFVKGI